MEIILAGNWEQAVDYARTADLRISGEPGTNKAYIVSSSRGVEGMRPTEVHIAPYFTLRQDAREILEVLHRTVVKMPTPPKFYSNNPNNQRLLVELDRVALNNLRPGLGDAVFKPEVTAAQFGPEFDGDMTSEQDHASEKAWDLVEAALDPTSGPYREQGPDRLLAAAQVYATLATRA